MHIFVICFLGDILTVDWQWHSMRAYYLLLKEYQEEFIEQKKKEIEKEKGVDGESSSDSNSNDIE